ncbi:YcjX family protein [Amylibacter sp. SFDW26]|uniref:YcjX family protein n=1 Tax=Amylibacter sp. SFDW26 TaxID=2652722 RepID=UPI0012627D79|nr:YcjX family protein [Amylibacter sp. SFDW26]KAB7610485.1 YcjX family protein [Amylibacter sp. SFDW26]
MVLGNIIDGIARNAERAADGVSEALFEPVVRLGVTGLSRSGKTVFITSLVANLMDRGRMPQLIAAQQGRIVSAFLQPQPDDTVPRFEYEAHLAAMTGAKPCWPQSTRSISQLRLSFRVQPSGIIAGVRGARTVHLDIVDYPGEWLLDLPLLNLSYEDWSKKALALAEKRVPQSDAFFELLSNVDPAKPLDELPAQWLAKSFTEYLAVSRETGFSGCAPGRFLMPGDLEGSPVLTFCPLPKTAAKRGTLYREFQRRYEAYKTKVVKPFFKDHFSRIDRQIVLVDALGAVHHGPQAVGDLHGALVEVLQAFKPGRKSWLASILGKRRVEKILFAATKADHLHHSQHPQLAALMQALVRDAKDRADFSGAQTDSIALASLRTTVEETHDHYGTALECVRGTLLETGKQAAMYAGHLPENPVNILNVAQSGATEWLDADYAVMNFLPAKISLKQGDGPPHIRLDRAAEFLLGDKLS